MFVSLSTFGVNNSIFFALPQLPISPPHRILQIFHSDFLFVSFSAINIPLEIVCCRSIFKRRRSDNGFEMKIMTIFYVLVFMEWRYIEVEC
jgi:hypothetical protein